MKTSLIISFAMLTLSHFAQQKVMVFGHRGCRGYYPENSIVAFQEGMKMGANGIELDVVVNKDKQLVVSHEPFFQKEYCLDPSGNDITDEKKYNTYLMTQQEIEAFDCGTKNYGKFPEQKKMKVVKPLFSTFTKEVAAPNTIVLFEIKSEKEEYNISQPEPKPYVELIKKELEAYPYPNNIIIMSFDPEIMEEVHKQIPQYRTVYLTYLPKSAKKFLKEISFKPTALGMFYPTVSKKDVEHLHGNGIQLFTWTVNDVKSAKKLVKLGVDALITDYPKLIIENK